MQKGVVRANWVTTEAGVPVAIGAASNGLKTSQLALPPLPRDTPRVWERTYVRLVVAADAAAAAVAGIAALAYKTSVHPSIGGYGVLAALLPLAWVTSIGIAGGYERRFLTIGPEEFRRVALGALGLIAFVGTVSWATQAEIARRFVVVALPMAAVLTWVARYALRKRVHLLRGRGAYLHRTVLLADSHSAKDLSRRLHKDAYHGYRIVGLCLPPHEASARSAAGAEEQSDLDVPVVGTFDGVAQAVATTGADSVIVLSSPEMNSERLRRLAWDLEPTGANLVVAPALVEVAGTRMAVRPVGGLSLLHVEQPRFTGVARLVKSSYEPILCGLALLLLAPLLAAIAVAIKIDSPGPVFFRQARVGRLGRTFTIYKFRTMVTDAEQRKHELAEHNIGAGPLFKVRRDPRVTRVGSFLRRTSLDELPQLFNVLAGHMSLVGPRPHLVEELLLFGEDFTRRLFVKPGITGLWQISGRSDLPFDESVNLDLRYVENWSLMTDVFIMWKTVSVLVTRKGAY